MSHLTGQLQGPLPTTLFCILIAFWIIYQFVQKLKNLCLFFKNDVIIYACGSTSEPNLRYSQGQVLYCSRSGDWKHISQVKASDWNTHQGYLPTYSCMYSRLLNRICRWKRLCSANTILILVSKVMSSNSKMTSIYPVLSVEMLTFEMRISCGPS